MKNRFTFAAVLIAGMSVASAATGAETLSDDKPIYDLWAQVFPDHVKMHTAASKSKPEATEFGGSLSYSKLIRYPQLTQLWAGYPFSIDFNEERGHYFVQADQMKTARNNKSFLNAHGFAAFGGQPAACMNCHSGWTPWLERNTGKELGLNEKDGWIAFNSTKYWTMIKNIPQFKDVDHHGIHGGTRMGVTCNDCHDPETNGLRLTRKAAINALIARGYEPDEDAGIKASRTEMKTLVCSQCHVEYYFRPTGKKTPVFAESIKDDPSKKWGNGTQQTYDEYDEWRDGNKRVTAEAAGLELVFPWDMWKKGEAFRIEMLDDYYEKNRSIFKQDFKHKITKAPMLKMQHPESEMFSSSVHAANGVACADCHMPMLKNAGLHQHDIVSPVKSITESCRSCHKKRSAENLLGQIRDIQRSVMHDLRSAEYAIVSLIQDIKTVREALGAKPEFQTNGKADEAKVSAELEAVLELHRKAQIRADFVGAENSSGFHSPREASRICLQGVDLARQGQVKLAEVAHKNGLEFKASNLGFEEIQKLNPGEIHFKADIGTNKVGDRYYGKEEVNGPAPKELLTLDKNLMPLNYKALNATK